MLSLTPPPFLASRRERPQTAAQIAGLRYEEKVIQYLDALYPDFTIGHPWFRFAARRGGRERWCQPDALLIDLVRGMITIVEVKVRHNSDAWWQLRKLYQPVVTKFFGEKVWEYSLLEICKWIDPAVQFPENAPIVSDIDDIYPGGIYLHAWSGKL